MADFLQKIKLGTRNTKLINWPNNKDQVVMLRILSEQERQEAAFATERYFAKENISISMGTADEYETEKANQILWRVLRDPTDSQPICKTVGDFRAAITRDERTYLINEYVTFEKDVSPNSENMTADEWDQFVSEVKKTPEETISNVLSSNTLRKLIITLANQLAILQKPSGSSLLGLAKQLSTEKKTPT